MCVYTYVWIKIYLKNLFEKNIYHTELAYVIMEAEIPQFATGKLETQESC